MPRTITATIGMLFLLTISALSLVGQEKGGIQQATKGYSYVADVAPIIKQSCISCHGTENENPSEYYMDDYESLMRGGRHGVTIIPGQPDSSMVYYKLLPDPPFGKQMPRGHGSISPEALHVIHDWIAQGAKRE